MKKCKVITINDRTDFSLLTDKKHFSVWENSAQEETINEYLAQGYEVKHMMWQSNLVIIYFEKDV
jgi:hypothetical protein